MRIRIIVTTLLVSVAVARAEIVLDDVVPALPGRFSVAASLRTRWEMWNWFEAGGTARGANNDYDFIGTTLRAASRWQGDWAEVLVEAQSSGLIDLPTTATQAAPQGNLGLGGVYFQHNRRRNDASIFLKQGALTLTRLGVAGLAARAGRFEFSEGNEGLRGDPTVDWIKNQRLSQRLIGPFAWSHVGRSLDGVNATWQGDTLHLTALLAHPTSGGFDLNGMHTLDDVDLAYGAVTWTRLAPEASHDARLFYVYYGDRRHQTKADNRSAAVRNDPAERQADIAIHTLGAHVLHVVPTGAGKLDAYLWGLGQVGDWGLLNHAAWAWSAEIGWQPPLPGKPWLRIGYARSSGDDDARDGTHHTFFQILPTPRVYSFSTFYNLMNSEDASIELLLRPLPGLVSRTEWHSLRLTEAGDLWYQGAGATLGDRNRAEGFGYAGRPSNGFRELFGVAQTSLSYDWNVWLNTNLYYGHIFGGAVVDHIFQTDQADFAYLEFLLRI